MTRKRFVKLMMSEGWDRNAANWLARALVVRGFAHSVSLEYIKGGNIGAW